jgi:hypothetical protein
MMLLFAAVGGGLAILLIWAIVGRLHEASRVAPSHRAARVAAGDRCPACRSGVIRPARGRFGDFLGCSAYPACGAAWRHGIRVHRRNYGTLG